MVQRSAKWLLGHVRKVQGNFRPNNWSAINTTITDTAPLTDGALTDMLQAEIYGYFFRILHENEAISTVYESLCMGVRKVMYSDIIFVKEYC